ncbi:MAG TPA: sulfite exporter TauE/SafE family protein [Pseudobacteroides sp.]|uniref:sulfite exporter TauE/SafE family protein n=1 Tax=Pseudobacteroides sp. TaxID=1968840 RepID=UPI002F930DA5
MNGNGFFLGLANGTVCLAYCSPVLVPYLLAEGNNIRFNFLHMGQFLLGRFVGYTIFGIMSWIASQLLLSKLQDSSIVFGILYLLFAVMMFFYGLSNTHKNCSAKKMNGFTAKLSNRMPFLVPFIFGLITGINLCPPLLLVFTEAMSKSSLVNSLLFFITFFAGTMIYFIPLPLLGLFSNFKHLKTIGKMAALLMSFYYLYIGIITIGGII